MDRFSLKSRIRITVLKAKLPMTALLLGPLGTNISNYLYFQQNSVILPLSTCIFIDIPVLFPSFPQWSFVFIDIPASFVEF